MDPILFANLLDSRLWYALPLIVSISLVYAATRHELFEPIVRHAVHTAVWIISFMLVVFAILFVISWWLGS